MMRVIGRALALAVTRKRHEKRHEKKRREKLGDAP